MLYHIMIAMDLAEATAETRKEVVEALEKADWQCQRLQARRSRATAWASMFELAHLPSPEEQDALCSQAVDDFAKVLEKFDLYPRLVVHGGPRPPMRYECKEQENESLVAQAKKKSKIPSAPVLPRAPDTVSKKASAKAPNLAKTTSDKALKASSANTQKTSQKVLPKLTASTSKKSKESSSEPKSMVAAPKTSLTAQKKSSKTASSKGSAKGSAKC